MKALLFIMSVIAAYLFLLGFSTRNTSNEPLGRALMIGGAIVFGTVLLALFLAAKSGRKNASETKNKNSPGEHFDV